MKPKIAKFPIESFVCSNYVKYQRLSGLVYENYKGSNANEINIYIDLYPIFKTLFKQRDVINLSSKEALTAAIINMCAHYRGFFKGLSVYTNFFLVYSSSMNSSDINSKFIKEYNASLKGEIFAAKEIVSLLGTTIGMLNTLCPYLPGIHLIQTSFETGVCMMELIARYGADKPNLIISRDPMVMQLCQLSKFYSVKILRPSKYQKDDISTIISAEYPIDNFWDSYFEMNKITKIEGVGLSPELLSVVQAFTRCTERGVRSVIQISTVIKALMNADIANVYHTDIRPLYDVIADRKKDIPIFEIFDWRFKGIDYTFQHSLFKNSVEDKLLAEQVKDLYDPEGVKEIFNKYFDENIIDLTKL